MKEAIEELSFFGGKVFLLFLVLFLALTAHIKEAIQIILAFILIYAIVIPIRALKFKPRPNPMQWSNFLEKFCANSLISIHTARATVIATILSTYFSSVAIGAFFYIMVLLVALSRYALGKHKIEDLIFGFLLGLGVSALVLSL
ncbi:MAG: phosphatase PAP2 family protein [Candidatus Nanoarchaeia archaeon]